MNCHYAIALYLIAGAFFAGRDLKGYGAQGQDWWRQVLVFIVLVLLTPIERLWDLMKLAGAKIDDVFQFRFYYLYFRGGFKKMDPSRLYNLDQVLFVKVHQRPNSLITKHYTFVVGLIFKQNGYVRRKWKIVNNKVKEVL